jgi:hypothetical protein
MSNHDEMQTTSKGATILIFPAQARVKCLPFILIPSPETIPVTLEQTALPYKTTKH